MTTITWKITNMLRNVSDGLVNRVGWEAVAVNGSTEAQMRGAVSVSRAESFTPFEQLTEGQVLAWVKASPETANVEATLTKRVTDLDNHVATIASGLPWSTQPPEMQE
jgi:hypothetical protein